MVVFMEMPVTSPWMSLFKENPVGIEIFRQALRYGGAHASVWLVSKGDAGALQANAAATSSTTMAVWRMDLASDPRQTLMCCMQFHKLLMLLYDGSEAKSSANQGNTCSAAKRTYDLRH